MTSFVVTGAALHRAASWAARVAPNRPVVPVLAGLLIRVADGEATITATNYDTWARVTLPVIDKEPGTLLLSANLITAIAKTVNSDVDVLFDDRGGDVLARCGRTEWSLPKLPADDFPGPAAAGPATCTIDADTFRDAVARVVVAASKDVTIAGLTGIRLEPSDSGRLVMAATDRFRLAAVEVPLLSGEAPTALVPAENLVTAARAPGDGPLELSMTGDLFGVRFGEHQLTGRQVAAEFPRWQGLVPAPREDRIVVAVEEVSRLIEHMQVLAPDGEDDATLMRFGDVLDASIEVAGKRAHAIGECTVHGDLAEPEITLRPAYMREALGAMGAATVSATIQRKMIALRPCTPDGDILDGYVHLVMGRRPRA